MQKMLMTKESEKQKMREACAMLRGINNINVYDINSIRHRF